jgi:hypothetical protein
MKTALMAASGRRLGDWRRHVKIDLDIQSNRVVNKVTGEQAVIPSGMTYSTLNGKNVAVFTSSVIGGIQLAHNPAFAARTGDFTLEVILDADGIHNNPADNSQLIPFCMWGTWGAPGQTMQLDALYNHLNTGLQVGIYQPSGNSFLIKSALSAIDLNIVNHFAFQRKNGVGYIYRNGVLVHTAAYPADLKGDVNGPFRIMSRRGGNAGDVWWRFIGKLIGFRFTHAAIYSGSSFQAPSSF